MPFKKKIDEKALAHRVNNWNTAQQIKKQQLGLLPNMWSSQNMGMYRQRFYALQGNETGLDQISREQIVRLSRELFFQLPGLGVASELKAEYVCGSHWNFVYTGQNKEWGKRAEDWVNNEWFLRPTTRGSAFDWRTVIRVMSRTLDMDGDVLMLFIRSKDNYPLIQFIGSHRVGTAAASMGGTDGVRVKFGSKFYKCLDGIVYTDDDLPIAFSIKRDDAQLATVPQSPAEPIKDIIISAESGQLIYKPIVYDKGRGLPCLYSSVLYGLQLSDLHNFIMDIAKLEATIAYVIKNDAGQAPQEYENLLNQIQAAGGANSNSALPFVEPTVHGISMVKSPTINYVKSEGGELESFRSQRPSEEIQAYIKTIECKLLSAIGIPSQMIYDPETISGRGVNAVTSLVLKAVSERQDLIKKHAKAAVAYALSVAMEEGLIPKNYKEDITKVIDFTMPPEFRLDSNADNRQNLELYKLGLMSGDEFLRENNGSYDTTRASRKQEIEELLTDVEEAKSKHPNVSEATILNLFTQRGSSTLSIKEEPTQTPDVNAQSKGN